MSDYIYTSNGLVNADDLMHYGVPGMKWGHRKRYTLTGKYERRRSAFEAGKRARLKTLDNAYATGENRKMGSARRVNRAAKKAEKAAIKESLAKSQAKNDAIQAKIDKSKNKFRDGRKFTNKSRTTGAKLATNLLAGPFANRTYASVIAAGGSKNQARAMTAVATVLGGPIGHLAVSAIYTNAAAQGRTEKKY
jgi:hypothetical protein